MLELKLLSAEEKNACSPDNCNPDYDPNGPYCRPDDGVDGDCGPDGD